MIIYKDLKDKTLIKTCVRLNKFNQLELFYYSDDNTITCFTYAEGYNECCIGYMYDCKLVDASTADAFTFSYNSMNAHIDDGVLFTPSKRIYRGLIK